MLNSGYENLHSDSPSNSVPKTILQRFVCEISFTLFKLIWSSRPVINVHMSRQLSCPVMAWAIFIFDHYLLNRSKSFFTWLRHQMEIFSALLALCAGNSPVAGEFPSKRPETRSFDAYFYLRLNKRLGKQSRRWWFKTPSRSLWRRCDEIESVTYNPGHSAEWYLETANGYTDPKRVEYK